MQQKSSNYGSKYPIRDRKINLIHTINNYSKNEKPRLEIT